VKGMRSVKPSIGSRRGRLTAGCAATNRDGLSVVAVAIGMTTGARHSAA
jgi:hypothetical protein